MITGAVVLYKTDMNQVKTLIHSFSPNKNRVLFIIDNSPFKNDKFNSINNIEYIFTGKNLGYGAANNIGIRRAIELESEYHIIMNPDISFESSIIEQLVIYAKENDDIIDIMPKILSPTGEEQYLAKQLPTPFDVFSRRFLPQIGWIKRNNDRYVMRNVDHSRIIDAPSLSGCFMFLNMKLIKMYKLEFDERFFMYFEDFDFVRRMNKVGRTIYYPFVFITHEHKQESYKCLRMLIYHIRSAILYFNKYGWIKK